ncbi:interferon regulatory factor 3 [Brachyhypopomus gauderio]|uniref:interferon regulatory factor 3 n=1 Tax=Brachyhypopomus gauderio TaxID=698409 RepID=UPI004042C65F
MAKSKPLFIPWLRQQIDSGQYPGVHWVNQEKTLFCIPWKHALRQDSNSEDVQIFKAWAHTNNSTNRIQSDPTVWKRNFRSTLRVKGFTLEVDSKNDSANPHKVFRWPEASHISGEGEESCDRPCDGLDLANEPEMFPDGSIPPDFLEKCLLRLDIGTGRNQDLQDPGMDQMLFLEQPVGGAQYTAVAISDVVGILDPNQESFSVNETGSLLQISPAEGTLAAIQFSPLEGAVGGEQNYPEEAVPTPNDSGSNQFSTHFKVMVYYKGDKVFEQVVENEAGFRLLSRNSSFRMSDSLTVVELPMPDSILDQTQAKLTRDILDNLGGVEVKRSGGVLLGHRWGDSRVYWGLCKHEHGQRTRALSKNQPEPIYFLRDFCTGLKEFMDNNGGPSPSYSLFFFLGEKWPDPRNRTWDKKLIMVEVVLTSLEILKLMAVENGASSLRSVELQLSLEQMMEIC